MTVVKKRIKGLTMATVTILTASIMLSGCKGEIDRKNSGMVIGAATGALLGSTIGGGGGQMLATVAGTMAGGMIGHEIGKSMEKNDDNEKRLNELEDSKSANKQRK